MVLLNRGPTCFLSALDRALQVFKALGDGTFPPLKAACGVASIIIQEYQAHKQLKKDNEDLAHRVADVVVALCAVYEADPATFSIQQDAHLEKLIRTLSEIRSSIALQAAVGRWMRFFKLQEFRQDIVTLNQELDDCCRLFNITSLAEIRKLLMSDIVITRTMLSNTADAICDKINQTVAQLEVSHKAIQSDINGLSTRMDHVLTILPKERSDISDSGFPLVLQSQVQLRRTICTLRNGHLHRGEYLSPRGLSRAIVRSYKPSTDGQKAYDRDVNFWKTQFHPNLPQLLGHTPSSSATPFVLMSDYTYPDVAEYMNRELEHDKVDSFMSTLKFLQGIASGLDYLREYASLSKAELHECGQVSNLVLTSTGQVIVGHNLIVSGSRPTRLGVEVNLDTWLLELFWWLGIRFIYGPREPDLTDWNWISVNPHIRSHSHLRILSSFLKYLLGSLTASARELEMLVELLDPHQKTGILSYPEIRRAVMHVRRWDVCNIYRPPKPMNVQFLDVGFIRDDEFVVLENCRNKFQYDTATAASLASRCTGLSETIVEEGNSGHLTHRFYNPEFAEIRRRTTYEKVKDYEPAWRFFMEYAQELRRKHSSAYPDLEIRDLILVVLIETDHRYTNIEWKDESEDPATPSFVDFIEFPETSIGRPWGYWKLEDGQQITVTADTTNGTHVPSQPQTTQQGKIASRAVVHSSRCAQSLTFLQLEDCDFP